MYFDTFPQSPPPVASSAPPSTGQEHGTENSPVTPAALAENMVPRPAVGSGHITAAATALAKQIRAELAAELGLTPNGQAAAAPAQQKRGPNKKEVVPLSEAVFNALLQTVCYDNSTRLFWKKNSQGRWLNLTRRDLAVHLMRKRMPDSPAEGELISQVDEYICRVQDERYVHMCCNIAGHRRGYHTFGETRILVLNEPDFIDPVQGDWSMLEGIFTRMFGEEQLPFIYGWIKVALGMFRQQTWMAGQVLALCGEKESGKNLFTELLNHIFGGRSPGKPYSYMTQGTDFNSDFIGAELLTIEDEVSHTSINARRTFGARIKDISVNKFRRLHRKNAEALVVVPFQRLVISLNDEHERMRVLPPMDDDIKDKIMLIKVFKHAMPMPTTTAKEREAFTVALVAQLPAFAHFLENWQIPPELVASRFGIKHFHHPDLLAALQESDPEESLLEMIDEVIFSCDAPSTPWSGLANELVSRLGNGNSPRLSRNIGDALRDITQCGIYLGRLASKRPDRVRRMGTIGGSQKWMIGAPGGRGSQELETWAGKIQPLKNKLDRNRQASLSANKKVSGATCEHPMEGNEGQASDPATEDSAPATAPALLVRELPMKAADNMAQGQSSLIAVKAASGDAGNHAAQHDFSGQELGGSVGEDAINEGGGAAEIPAMQDGGDAEVLSVAGEKGPGSAPSCEGGTEAAA